MPKFAGLRNGAAVLTDGSGNTIATGYVHGIGSGPQVSFLPGSQSTLGSGFRSPWGAAVDGSGNVFVADFNSRAVYEILAGGYTTVNSLLCGGCDPVGIAVDGSDNVFVADLENNAVHEILAAGGYTTVKTLGSGFYAPFSITVDVYRRWINNCTSESNR